MNDAQSRDAQEVHFDEVEPVLAAGGQHLTIDDLRKVHLTVTADLGQCKMLVRDILEIKQGSVVALDKPAGDMVDLYVNGIPLAKGEVVVIADMLHVRIAEVAGAAGKDETPDE
jgi:flagellar motor switch protein FliN/FliY